MDSIHKAVELSHIGTSDTGALCKDIDTILQHVGEVTRASEEAMAIKKQERINVFRSDKVTVPQGEFSDLMLSQSPDRHENWFKVKKVL